MITYHTYCRACAWNSAEYPVRQNAADDATQHLTDCYQQACPDHDIATITTHTTATGHCDCRRHQRTLGSLLGGAIGDALGAPIEFDTSPTPPETLHYQRNPKDIPAPLGAITDDTQLTIATITALITAQTHYANPLYVLQDHYLTWRQQQTHGPADPRNAPNLRFTAYIDWLHHVRAPGGACLAMHAQVPGVSHPSPDAKGCGTVMRSAPFGFYPDTSSAADAYALAAKAANISHGHPTAHHAAGAMAYLVHTQVDGSVPLREAVIDIGDTLSGVWHDEQDIGAKETNHALWAALQAGEWLATPDDMERWSEDALEDQGWTAATALAMAVAANLAADGDADRLYRLACWHSGDSDSVGSIAGNLYGATYGADALPADLVEGNEATDLLRALADHLTNPPDAEAMADLYPR